MNRECVVCGLPFLPNPTGRKSIVCGVECRAEYGRRAMKVKYRASAGIVSAETERKCRWCGKSFHSESLARHYCSAECRRSSVAAADSKRKRAGSPLGGEISCSDCGNATVRRGSQSKRCGPCQQGWNAKKSARLRSRQPDRQREMDTLAAARRRQTEAGAAAYRQQCRNWRSLAKNRLRVRISGMMKRALVEGKQGKSWIELVPYTLDDLRDHLERQFCKGMTWDNMGKWHIDHIVPVAAFNFSSSEDEDFKACWALTNLRPLWAEENQRKSAKRIFLI